MIMNAEKVKNIINAYHKRKINFSDQRIDKVLGIRLPDKLEKDLFQLNTLFGDEQYIYEGTPYRYIRDFVTVCQPSKNNHIYDLGSGYGRVVIYGALVSDAQFSGIEIVPDRYKQSQQIAFSLALENAKFLSGNVSNYDLSDGDIFFLFNPFSEKTLKSLGEQLKQIASRKAIQIITWGGISNDYFSSQHWLNENKEGHRWLQYFYSTQIKDDL